jgi:hypothetical protein
MRQSLNDNTTQRNLEPLFKPANWIIRGAFLLIHILLVFLWIQQPRVLFPKAGGKQCHKCFNLADEYVRYRSSKTGLIIVVPMCTSCAKIAPDKTFSNPDPFISKNLLWILMILITSTFIIASIGITFNRIVAKIVFLLGAIPVFFVLLGNFIYLIGLHFIGRLIAWPFLIIASIFTFSVFIIGQVTRKNDYRAKKVEC